MMYLSVILLVLTIAIWFCQNEHDGLFGVYYPTSAVRQAFFPFVVLFSFVAGIYLSENAGITGALPVSFNISEISFESNFVMLLAALICLGVMKFFSIRGAAAFAYVGSLTAYAVSTGRGFPEAGFMLSFLVGPVVASLFAFLLTRLQKAVFGSLNLHLISLSYYMRNIVTVGVVVSSFGLGLNWGGFISGVADILGGGQYAPAIVLVIISLLIFLRTKGRYAAEDESTGAFADFSIYVVVSVGFAVALTLVLFSFSATTGLVGLKPAPMSVSILVLAAISGTELAQKSDLVDRTYCGKEIAAFIAAPGGSFCIAYLFLYIIGVDKQSIMDDIVVIVAAVVVLVALAFAGYVRRQMKQHEIKDKLVYTQQQQIYEHSRALNDMELKVVLSENQALHNAVEMKRQEVMNVALSIVEQREYLESLNETVTRLSKTEDTKEQAKLISELKSSLKQRLSHDREVDSQYFYAQAESLHEDFNAKLAENFPDLTQQEKRLAALLRLGFSSKYIATLMNITPKSVEISRYRLRQKLSLSRGDNLVNFIKSI